MKDKRDKKDRKRNCFVLLVCLVVRTEFWLGGDTPLWPVLGRKREGQKDKSRAFFRPHFSDHRLFRNFHEAILAQFGKTQKPTVGF
jgi:hypothetical protein